MNVKHILQAIKTKRFWHIRNSTRTPYPVYIASRNYAAEDSPLGGGLDVFDNQNALNINEARLTHLASLDLSLSGKSVLDVGCGVGHLAEFFVNQGCQVTGVDGRTQNINSLRARYPNLQAHVGDVERDPLSKFGGFDIVFCYGLLYHLENPIMALRNMTSVCREVLLLETMVCDHTLPLVRIEDEPFAFNQALKGIGCRPSPSYVVLTLNRIGFPFVYAPVAPPMHQDFQFKWKNNLDIWRGRHPLRCIFVASKIELNNSNLFNLLEN